MNIDIMGQLKIATKLMINIDITVNRSDKARLLHRFNLFVRGADNVVSMSESMRHKI
ncbi:MAG: hypothetical protein ACR5K4_03860 [Sodalis sp. (in: enterobacteria)]